MTHEIDSLRGKYPIYTFNKSNQEEIVELFLSELKRKEEQVLRDVYGKFGSSFTSEVYRGVDNACPIFTTVSLDEKLAEYALSKGIDITSKTNP